jgi:hypothetical protein
LCSKCFKALLELTIPIKAITIIELIILSALISLVDLDIALDATKLNNKKL